MARPLNEGIAHADEMGYLLESGYDPIDTLMDAYRDEVAYTTKVKFTREGFLAWLRGE